MAHKQGERTPSTTTQSPVVGGELRIEKTHESARLGDVRKVFLSLELEDGRSEKFACTNFSKGHRDGTDQVLDMAAKWLRGELADDEGWYAKNRAVEKPQPSIGTPR